jgi:DNA invertase Pin-like site-specific DNA recombinase
MQSHPKNPAVYLRVSTTQQETESQRREIQRYLDGNELPIGMGYWFEDFVSGKTMDRPGLKALNAAIFNGEIDAVILYSVDRFSRSMAEGLTMLEAWQKAGVRMIFVSQHLDVNPRELTGQLILKVMTAMLLGFAEMERERITARRQAGFELALERTRKMRALHKAHPELTAKELARRCGFKKITHAQWLLDHPHARIYWGPKKGRRCKKTSECTPAKIREMLDRGFKMSEIAKLLGVCRDTVYRRAGEMGGIDSLRAECSSSPSSEDSLATSDS